MILRSKFATPFTILCKKNTSSTTFSCLLAWDDVQQHRAKQFTEMNASEFKRIGNTFFLMNCDLSHVGLSILSITPNLLLYKPCLVSILQLKKFYINFVAIREVNQNLQLEKLNSFVSLKTSTEFYFTIMTTSINMLFPY